LIDKPLRGPYLAAQIGQTVTSSLRQADAADLDILVASQAALAVGALLAIGPRTVTNCLRALGLAEHPSFAAFHHVLNRNVWSGLALAP
jgi:hypothetical protein